ncbi:phosphoadenosine phosphosulfate reductase family protein [Treponema saccharophilum]|uniref:Phosphoadenosine phosphosulfate reductase n=1 Tax=Treponema saccharophilum DSM 2985 TaxID=907348 RepID=H7EL58_9SPIR|nr:phosphoadenosine phosphosulfate reductase family protein [Treponema saccharophilum]EIC01783.1 phosphoadenosine phosphosulfate reductase [Treponema saccharophilum DSM 2985]BDC97162.1 phosphoadenosine phosphosulfate reductase [Treponema saccharophilum]
MITRLSDIDEVSGKGVCPLCGGSTTYLSSDLRPVFPEERLLTELLLKKEPFSLAKKSLWAQNSRYYSNGKSKSFPSRTFLEADCDALSEKLAELKSRNESDEVKSLFEAQVDRFVRANKTRLNMLIEEAHSFIKREAEKFPIENIVLSFSGGKDSTVTADIVTKALSNPSLVHIFGNTTLEFPMTIEYARRFRENHPYAIFETAINDEQDFMKVCDDIGPPARMMRWCCSMFKTGPITRTLNALYRNQQILTFYGIRHAESVSRSKYNRVEDDKESVKIQKQTVASPIIDWKDIDVWLYILSEKVDFNDAYRLGYDRVGCWCCPNNNQRAQFLSRIYMKERSANWREFLVSFAKKIGKPDAEVYVDSGAWKARQGGNGLPASADVKIRFTNCTAEEHAKNYALVRPFDDSLVNLFVPFGKVSRELGRKILHEVLVLDIRTNVPIISLQPFVVDGFENAVKIRTMNVADHEALQRQIAYQIRKFNACRKCLKCESVCRSGAISITADGYRIDEGKCVHCKMCVNQAVLENGCLMGKYLRTKGGI